MERKVVGTAQNTYMNYDFLFLVGRILYGVMLFKMAFAHFTNTASFAQYAAVKGVPAPKLGVLASGLLLALGALGIALGVYIEYAVLAIALFFVPVTFMMHAFWGISDPNMRSMEKIQFQKNMALFGAALMFLAIPAPWPYAVL